MSRTRALYRCAIALCSPDDARQFVEQLLTLALDLFDADCAGVYLSASLQKDIGLAARNFTRGLVQSRQLEALDEFLMKHVLQQSGVLSLEGEALSSDLRAFGMTARLPVCALVAAPLARGDSLQGLVYVGRTSPRSFTEDASAFALAFAGVAASALERVRLEVKAKISEHQVSRLAEEERFVEQLRQRERELAVLKSLTGALTQSLDLDEVMRLALEKAMDITGMEAGGVTLLDEESGELVLRVHSGFTPELLRVSRYRKLGMGLTGHAAATGEPVYVEDVPSDPRSIPAARDFKHRSLVCIPLKLKEKTLGTLTVTSKELRPISKEDKELLVSIGYLVGGAIEKAQMHEQSVQSYYERLVMRGDRLALITTAQRQEHDRLVGELRRAATNINAFGTGAEPSGATDACGVWDPLRSTVESILAAAVEVSEGRSLPELLEVALRRLQSRHPVRRQVTVDTGAWPSCLPGDVIFHLYRIVMDSVTCLAPSGTPQGVKIVLGSDVDRLEMQIRVEETKQNRGLESGQPLTSFNVNLDQVRERVHMLGGKLAIDTSVGDWTNVTVTVPRYWDQTEEAAPIRVLIADEQDLFGQALANLLDAEKHVQVIGVARNKQELLRLVRRLSPDVVVLDTHTLDMRGMDVVSALRTESPQTKVMLLTGDNPQEIVEGLVAGATRCQSKSCSPVEFVQALRSMVHEGVVITPHAADRALAFFEQSYERGDRTSPVGRLTRREVDILQLLASGRNSKEICQLLRIKDKTVRQHISNMYQKLQIYDRTQLVLYAVKRGLIHVDRET